MNKQKTVQSSKRAGHASLSSVEDAEVAERHRKPGLDAGLESKQERIPGVCYPSLYLKENSVSISTDLD